MDQNILEQILDGTIEPTDLPLETLRNITDNFSNSRIIGEGGFATVYKGVLQNGNVAVKKIMSSMTIDEKLFRREVDSLMEVNHQNVVKFLGFCSHTVHTPVKNPESRGYIYAEKRERLLCFEYVSNGSLNKHITDELRGLEWDARYQVIKGICTGLHYLHMEKHILHMDLKPANILLDNKRVPKITDFGLSRPTENSRTTSASHFSSPGYEAPENLFGHGRMSVKSDIYSLGRIIIEVVTGHKSIPDDNNNILRRWRHRWIKSATETPLAYQQQVIKCIEIGMKCQSIDPYKRPFISDVMNEIGEIESMNSHIMDPDEPKIFQINAVDDMLGVEPLELRFANYVNKNDQISSSCSIELSNNTNGFIAFSIQTNSPLTYCIDPNNDIVPPQSKLSVGITLLEATKEHDNALSKYNTKHYIEQFIVRSIKVNEGFVAKDINQDMFEKGKDVDEVHLTVASEAQLLATSCIPLSEGPPKEVIPSQEEWSEMMLLNVHPLVLRFPFIPKSTIPCSLHLTNNTDEPVVFRLMKKNVQCSTYMIRFPVHGIVPPNSTYTVVLTTYEMNELPRDTNMDLILQSSAANGYIQPFIDDGECEQFLKKVKETGDTFNEVALQAVCAPIGETTYEVWNLDSPESSYTLSGHSDHLRGVDFFTRDDQLYLISCSDDLTVKIWDMKEKTCIHTIEAFTSPVTCVISHSDRPYLLTGSKDGLVHLWSSTNFRLERIFSVRGGDVCGLICLKESKGFIIGQDRIITVMDIGNEE